MELPIVVDVARSSRKRVNFRPGGIRTRSETFQLPDLIKQMGFNNLWRHMRARIVVHLAQVGLRPQAPGFRQLLSLWPGLGLLHPRFIEKPRHLSPAAQPLLELDFVWTGMTQQDEQIASPRFLTDRL